MKNDSKKILLSDVKAGDAPTGYEERVTIRIGTRSPAFKMNKSKEEKKPTGNVDFRKS